MYCLRKEVLEGVWFAGLCGFRSRPVQEVLTWLTQGDESGSSTPRLLLLLHIKRATDSLTGSTGYPSRTPRRRKNTLKLGKCHTLILVTGSLIDGGGGGLCQNAQLQSLTPLSLNKPPRNLPELGRQITF